MNEQIFDEQIIDEQIIDEQIIDEPFLALQAIATWYFPLFVISV